jgi:hypothetical protein
VAFSTIGVAVRAEDAKPHRRQMQRSPMRRRPSYSFSVRFLKGIRSGAIGSVAVEKIKLLAAELDGYPYGSPTTGRYYRLPVELRSE